MDINYFNYIVPVQSADGDFHFINLDRFRVVRINFINGYYIGSVSADKCILRQHFNQGGNGLL